MKRFVPEEIVEGYKRFNIKPSFNYFFHTNFNGSVEACIGGMLALLKNPNRYVRGDKYQTKGFPELISDTGSSSYAWGCVLAFTDKRTEEVFGYLCESTRTTNPFQDANWEEFTQGIEDARKVAELMGLTVNNDDILSYVQENKHKLDPRT